MNIFIANGFSTPYACLALCCVALVTTDVAASRPPYIALVCIASGRRPGLRRFLAQAATMFEMTIYTAGTSQYADAVSKVGIVALYCP
ncbi:MAG: NIF family HAD-type phosphatase [Winogradskyella sp.]|uniref:NIF family HAD-type phosphatase n=1 Tax=Winogradskyella sp. TaxID=1883156 RepID=UPI00385A9816